MNEDKPNIWSIADKMRRFHDVWAALEKLGLCDGLFGHQYWRIKRIAMSFSPDQFPALICLEANDWRHNAEGE